MLNTRRRIMVAISVILAIISKDVVDADSMPHCRLQVSLPLGILGYAPGNYGVLFSPGDTLKFYCVTQDQITYNLTGPPKIQCDKNYMWSAKPPRCKAILCSPSPPSVPNARLLDRLVPGKTNKIGKMVRYNCSVGYSPPYLTKVCQKDGYWQGNVNCTRTICKRTILKNGHVSLNPSLVYGSIATYTCNTGYVLTGPSTRTCNKIGKWSGNEPQCSKKCPKIDGLLNGLFLPQQQLYNPGQTVTFHCYNDRYVVKGSLTRKCLDDGSWTGSSTKCVINQCQSVGTFKNGNIVFDKYPYIIGTLAKFQCQSGYKMFGSHIRVCQGNGMWSGARNPMCKALSCGEPGMLTNGKHLPQYLNGNYPYGTIVKYSCLYQFYLWGNSSIECKSFGLSTYWSGLAPDCLTLTQFSSKCHDSDGHFHIEHGHPRCVHQAALPTPITSDSATSRQIDTLTIVTASAGSTLGALIILLSIMVFVRRFHRNRRFRHQAIRSRFYSDDDHVTLITCPRGFNFGPLPSYDEAMSQVQRDPPPFDTVVQDNGTTVINNNINITMPADDNSINRGANESRTHDRTVLEVSADQQINIVNNPMTASSHGELDSNSTANQVNNSTRNSISSQESLAISEPPSLSMSEDEQSISESQPLIGSN